MRIAKVGLLVCALGITACTPDDSPCVLTMGERAAAAFCDADNTTPLGLTVGQTSTIAAMAPDRSSLSFYGVLSSDPSIFTIGFNCINATSCPDFFSVTGVAPGSANAILLDIQSKEIDEVPITIILGGE